MREADLTLVIEFRNASSICWTKAPVITIIWARIILDQLVPWSQLSTIFLRIKNYLFSINF